MKRTARLRPALLLFALLGSLGCSVGTLLVRAPTPTRVPTKTPRATYTYTPNWTPTRMPTMTPTPTLPPTGTPLPTNMPELPTTAPEPTTAMPEAIEPAEPPPPADTATPEAPTATPTPQFVFTVTPFTFDTQGAVETRVTAFIVEVFDASTGSFQDLYDYQVKLIDPTGGEHQSNMSGGKNHTIGEGLGNDRWFNSEVKFSPYTPGHYKAWLVKDGVQQSPAIEFDMSPSPTQYVHLDIFKNH